MSSNETITITGPRKLEISGAFSMAPDGLESKTIYLGDEDKLEVSDSIGIPETLI